MTDIKCPFCEKKLQLALNVDGREFYWCGNYDCDGVNYGVGNKELWQELLRTRKALDVAVDALFDIHKHSYACCNPASEIGYVHAVSYNALDKTGNGLE